MTTYVSFLRAINVSGHNLIKMADLKMALQPLKLKDLRTYLQSGNLVFESHEQECEQLEKLISEVIQSRFGLDIKVKVIRKDHVMRSVSSNPFIRKEGIDTKYLYYIHLMGKADEEVFKEIQNDKQIEEQMFLSGEVIYLFYPNGYGRSKLNNNYFEKKLKVASTARNHNTMINICSLLKEFPG